MHMCSMAGRLASCFRTGAGFTITVEAPEDLARLRAVWHGLPGAEARRPLGLAVQVRGFGTMALTMTERAAADVRIPAQYVRFLLYGNPPGSVYDFGATAVNAWWTREYAMTLATTLHDVMGLPSLSVGVGGKIVHGYGVAQVTRFNSRLETGTNGVLTGAVDMESRSAGIDPIAGTGNGGYSPFPEPAGEGFGVDLGLAAQLSPLLRVGLSVTDIGSITWSRNVRVARAESTFVVDNPADETQRDAVEHALRGEAHDGDPFTTPKSLLCESCHAPPTASHPGGGTKCANCHTPNGWTQLSVNHNQVGFALAGQHLSVSCQECHGDPFAKAASTRCEGCHKPPSANHPGGGANCATCHGTNGIKPYPAWHAQRGYTSVDCSSCHELKIENGTVAGATRH